MNNTVGSLKIWQFALLSIAIMAVFALGARSLQKRTTDKTTV